MARKSVPINLIIYHPKTECGKKELAKRIASVHADTVLQYIRNLSCNSAQKKALLDAVIHATASSTPYTRS